MRVKQTGCDRVEQIFCQKVPTFFPHRVGGAREGPERLQGSRVCTSSLACISSLYHPSVRMRAATWPTRRFRLLGGGKRAGESESLYYHSRSCTVQEYFWTARVPRSTPSTCRRLMQQHASTWAFGVYRYLSNTELSAWDGRLSNHPA